MSRLYVAILKEITVPKGFYRHCEACGKKYHDDYGRIDHTVAQFQDRSFAIRDEVALRNTLLLNLVDALNGTEKEQSWLDRMRGRPVTYTAEEVMDALTRAFEALLEGEREKTIRVP